MAKISAIVDKIILKTKKRMVAVAQGSVADTVTLANTPTAKGGKMRVVSGFLRASGRISLSGVPSGPSRPVADTTYSFSFPDIVAGLTGVELGDVIYFGWAANYARVRELHDGFLESALMRWQETVDSNVRKVKARIK